MADKNLKLRLDNFKKWIPKVILVSKTLFVLSKKSIKSFIFYFKIWLLMSKNSFLGVLTQKKVLLIFLFGKILRFIFFIVFLLFIIKGVNNLAGYSTNQTIFFFLSFSVVDTISQFLFREVYRFRSQIVTGDFDLVLSKPISALFRVLLGGADVMDFITIPPLFAATYYVGSLLNPDVNQVILYLLLILSALIISAGFHILVMSLGIITLEIDHTMMIYRDLSSMGRFPIDIYQQPLRGILTYFIPIGIMMTLPTKALIGLVNIKGAFISFIIAFFIMFLSLRFWNFALRKYSSASS